MKTFFAFILLLSTSAFAQGSFRVSPGKILMCTDMASLNTCETPGVNECKDEPGAEVSYAQNCKENMLKDCAAREKSFGCESIGFSSEKAMIDALGKVLYKTKPQSSQEADILPKLQNIKAFVSKMYKDGRPVILKDEINLKAASQWLLDNLNDERAMKRLTAGFGDCKLADVMTYEAGKEQIEKNMENKDRKYVPQFHVKAKPERKALTIKNTGLSTELGVFLYDEVPVPYYDAKKGEKPKPKDGKDKAGRLSINPNNSCELSEATGGKCNSKVGHMIGVPGQAEMKNVSLQYLIDVENKNSPIRAKNFKTAQDYLSLNVQASLTEIVTSGICNKVFPAVPESWQKHIDGKAAGKNPVANNKSVKVNDSERGHQSKDSMATKLIQKKPSGLKATEQ